MPYADPEKRKEAKRKSYAKRYENPAFQQQEAARKAAWLQTETGKKKNAAATGRHNRRAATLNKLTVKQLQAELVKRGVTEEAGSAPQISKPPKTNTRQK